MRLHVTNDILSRIVIRLNIVSRRIDRFESSIFRKIRVSRTDLNFLITISKNKDNILYYNVIDLLDSNSKV